MSTRLFRGRRCPGGQVPKSCRRCWGVQLHMFVNVCSLGKHSGHLGWLIGSSVGCQTAVPYRRRDPNIFQKSPNPDFCTVAWIYLTPNRMAHWNSCGVSGTDACGKFVRSALFFCYRRCFIFVFCSESYVWSGPVFCLLLMRG